MIDQTLVRRFRGEVADQLSAYRTGDGSAGRDPLADADLRQLAHELLARALERYAQERFTAAQPALDPAEEDQIVDAVLALLFGLGRLQPFLDDPNIENIDANGCDRVFLRYADGTKRMGEPIADSDAGMVELIRSIGSRMGLAERRFDTANPQLDLQLPDGSRLSAIMRLHRRRRRVLLCAGPRGRLRRRHSRLPGARRGRRADRCVAGTQKVVEVKGSPRPKVCAKRHAA